MCAPALPQGVTEFEGQMVIGVLRMFMARLFERIDALEESLYDMEVDLDELREDGRVDLEDIEEREESLDEQRRELFWVREYAEILNEALQQHVMCAPALPQGVTEFEAHQVAVDALRMAVQEMFEQIDELEESMFDLEYDLDEMREDEDADLEEIEEREEKLESIRRQIYIVRANAEVLNEALNLH